ncbi:MAG TPA: TIGR03435 family protein [Acidobacteriaceae bacterium]|nr:TIGR03435 family protein [Acidobacteriaceae bacterium]
MRAWIVGVVFAGAMMMASVSFGQTAASKLTFDVASVRPSPAPDMKAMIAGLQAGKLPNSVRINGSRATFTYESLNDLIMYAYKLQRYEISGPEWMVTDRFDIDARLPDGATKDDVPEMLRALLKERFNLTTHNELQEQPVLALVIGKGGSKLKESTEKPVALDESEPLKDGETQKDTPDGPIRLLKNADGSTTYNMGVRGTFTLKYDDESSSMHMGASSITMKGFAVMMNSLGAGQGRQIVDMTAVTGNYQAAADFSLMDLMASLSSQGINLPTRPGSGGGSGEATDPEGGATVSAALEKLGLKLEKSRAKVGRLVVDHVEKTPTEN